MSFYVVRVTSLQLFRSTYLRILAAKQHNILIELKPERGDIFDRNMRCLALDHNVYSVFAMPHLIEEADKEQVARKLAPVLGMGKGSVLERIKKDKYFVWVKRELDEKKKSEVEALNLDGIELMKEYKRFYPNSGLACHVLGFAGLDDTGLEGVELAYDSYLKGTSGWRWTVRDAKRRDILADDKKFIPPSEGLHAVLTIDEAIQHIAERELDAAYRKYEAKGATIIIMDPYEGSILALANRPAYDLNNFDSSSENQKRNRAVTDVYEPGSVYKIVTASTALENKVVTLGKVFYCENGQYAVAGRILHDSAPHKDLTFREVIEKSSNIGTVKVAMLIDKNELYRYSRLFGFGERTGIDIPGEINGILRPPSKWSKTTISCLPIGQEVGVTSVQLVSAIAAIANGGYLVKPRIVREIINDEHDIIRSFPPVEVRRVISKESSDTMKDILYGAVEKGTGRNAILEQYTTAGKTGTAQKVGPDGRYSHTQFVASFAGFAPANDPKIAIIVMLDEPKKSYYGGTVAAPVFANVARDVLRYLKVEPDKKKETTNL